MKQIYTMAKYAKSMMLAAVLTVGVTVVDAQVADNTTYAPAEANSWWRGEEVTGEEQQIYVYNVGAGIFVTTDNTPAEKNIDNAALWTLSKNQFSCGDFHINLWSFLNWGATWHAGVNKDAATTYKIIAGSTDNKGYSYKLSKKDGLVTQYFSVNNGKYTASVTNSDFLFISPKQKEVYSAYTKLYNEANTFTNNKKVSNNLLDLLKEILTETAAANYSTYETDKNSLENIINTIKVYLEKTTPTGIEDIYNNTNTKAEAIYSVNGVRNARLSKGLNIVKMSDGSIKKVMVK